MQKASICTHDNVELCSTTSAKVKISGSEELFRWLVNLTSLGLNLTLRKIIYFISRRVNSRNFGKILAFIRKVPLRATNKLCFYLANWNWLPRNEPAIIGWHCPPLSVVNPGFPVGAPTPRGGGTPYYYFGFCFPENCMKFYKKKWIKRGHTSLSPPIYPPMPFNGVDIFPGNPGSATDIVNLPGLYK